MIVDRNSNGKLSRKGQMEAIGLVIIVILIALGMLFMATFALKSNPQKKIFTRKGLAYSTMSALMKTTVSGEAACSSLNAEAPKIGGDVLEDCAKYKDVDKSLYQCIGPISQQPLHSCVFLEEMLTSALHKTLGGWHKNYEFHSQLITLQGETPVDIIKPICEKGFCEEVGGGCPKSKERDSSGLFPINTGAGLVENTLYLCD